MKSRAETKERILSKSREIKARRRTRFRTAAVTLGAASAAAMVIWVGGGLPGARNVSPSDATAGGYTETGRTEERSPESGSEWNARYPVPDRVRIYRTDVKAPAMELLYSRESDRPSIERLRGWLSGLKCSPGGEPDTESECLYALEMDYGGEVMTVYIRGRSVRYGDGEWQAIDGNGAEEFTEILKEIG